MAKVKKTDKKKKKGGFVYKGASSDRIKRQAEQTGNRFDGIIKNGVDMFKFKPGDNTFRILPATWDGSDYYGLEVFVHQYVGAGNGSYLCLAKMQKKRCPICESAKEARDNGDKEEADSLAAKQRYLFYVIDRDDEATGVKLLEMSWSMDQAIAALCQSRRRGDVVAIDNPDTGRDVTVQKKGQGINTKYYGHRIDSEPTPINDDEDVQESILEHISETPLTDVLMYQSADYLESVMSGASASRDDDDEDEDEDEDDRKSKKGGKSKKADKKSDKKKRRDEDDDEDEDEGEEPPFDADEDEDEDEDDRKSSKKGGKSSKKRRDDDDDDDDDEEEDEDEDDRKSSKKKSGKKSSRDEDDEDEDDEDEDDEDEEDEDDDEEEDEDDEDDRKSKKSGKASKKDSSSKKGSGGKSARARRFGR